MKIKNSIIGFLALILLFVTIVSGLAREPIVVSFDKNGSLSEVIVEVVTTNEDKMKGLMYRDYLEDGHGMLFVYEKNSQVMMWMKNMQIPLDIIFIGSDSVVKHIEQNVPPCYEIDDNLCPRYRSIYLVSYALEVPANFVAENGISVGDSIVLPSLAIETP